MVDVWIVQSANDGMQFANSLVTVMESQPFPIAEMGGQEKYAFIFFKASAQFFQALGFGFEQFMDPFAGVVAKPDRLQGGYANLMV